MLILLLLLLLLWLALAGVVTAWSIWFQTAIYTEPSTGLAWRGPAAASAIMGVVFLWVILDYRTLGRFQPLWNASSSETSVAFPELRVPGSGGKEEVYTLRPGSRNEYRSASGKSLPSTPDKIIVTEGDKQSTFEPRRDAKGNLERQKVGGMADPLRYKDAAGRIMLEGQLGQIETSSGSVFIGSLILHLFFVAACFLALWLLVRFQWMHALGQAVVLAVALLLFVLPPILGKAEAVAKANAALRKQG